MILGRDSANAPVAQLDRVFGYEPKGRGFESLLARQSPKAIAFGDYFLLPIHFSLKLTAKPLLPEKTREMKYKYER